MELLITQLTDIHIRDNADFDIVFERTNSIGGAICDHITDPDNTEVLFCITGDFAFEGLEYQYDAVGLVLEAVYMVIKGRFPRVGIYPLFVPGNHDCDFKTDENSLRETILASPVLNISDASQFKICTSIQKNYFAFCDEWYKKYGAMSCARDKVLTVNELQLENIHIQIHCINTSWCSRKREEKGKMKITTGKMKLETGILPEKKCDDIVITMMHHSAEWLDWDDREVWDEYHRKYSDIILVGHEHKAECVKKTNYDETTNMFIMGNQLFDKYLPDQSGFNILKIVTGIKPMQECFFHMSGMVKYIEK